MIEYKIDQKPSTATTSHIKDMDAVLREIINTYEVMLDVLNQHEAALSSPSINTFRKGLKEQVVEAIDAANSIVDDTRKLVIISDQASKQLQAIEDHFHSALEKHSSNTARVKRNNYQF